MKAFKFNTGRQYTPEGQVIVCWLVDEGTDDGGQFATVRFFDTARNITGEIATQHYTTERRIMEMYDGGFYKEISHMPGVEAEKAQALELTA